MCVTFFLFIWALSGACGRTNSRFQKSGIAFFAGRIDHKLTLPFLILVFGHQIQTAVFEQIKKCYKRRPEKRTTKYLSIIIFFQNLVLFPRILMIHAHQDFGQEGGGWEGGEKFDFVVPQEGVLGEYFCKYTHLLIPLCASVYNARPLLL